MFKSGAIIKIVLHNFITYKYVEFSPGPKVNLVLGPNGTGKSTIVAGIILGLGGTPKDVGRGTHVAEYVQHNYNKALIEITLHGFEEHSKIKISREFNTSNKNVWKINNQQVTANEVAEYVQRMKVQVNNLCQFLPQERVQEFARLNIQELLSETQMALGRTDLVEKQRIVVEASSTYLAKKKQLQLKSNYLQDMRSKLENLAPRVENFKVKKQYMKQINQLNAKIAWMNYHKFRDSQEVVLQDKNLALQQVEQMRQRLPKMERTVSVINDFVQKLTEKASKCKSAILESSQSSSQVTEKIRKLKEQADKIEKDRDSYIAHFEQINQEITLINIEIKQLKQQIVELQETHGDDSQLGGQIERLCEAVREIKTKILDKRNAKDRLTYKKNEHVYELKSLKERLHTIRNVHQLKLNWLRMHHPSAHKACEWLDQNKHRFQHEIYKPMILELNVLKSEDAIYFENTIAMRERVAFTCTSVDDMNLLIKLLEKENIAANVVYSDPSARLDSFRPKIPIENLSNLGFHVYLTSLCEAPEPIMTYLCQNKNLHNIPVGSEQPNFDKLPRSISLFFAGNFRSSVKYSEYSGERIVVTEQVRGDGSFSMVVDTVKLEQIIGKVNSLKAQLDVINGEVKSVDDDIQDLSKQELKVQRDVQGAQRVRSKLETLNVEIRVKEKIVAGKKTCEDRDDVESSAKKQLEAVLKAISEEFSNYKAIKERTNNPALLLKLIMDKLEKVKLDKDTLMQESHNLTLKLGDKERTLSGVENELKNAENKTKSALKDAMQSTDGLKDTDEGFERFKKTFDKLPASIEELQTKRDTVYSLAKLLHDPERHELEEFERLKVSTEKDSKDIEASTVKVNSLEAELSRCSDEWLTPVHEFISKINDRFRSYFQMIGCVGEISLFTDEQSQDFSKYGLSIKVSFRDNIELQALNSMVHSGGERAITTALYMLSLQDLTPVPFRCVDEINQGMDETNERLVYKLLFNISQNTDTSQYFIISPKLLSNMEYSENIAVHIIYDNVEVNNA